MPLLGQRHAERERDGSVPAGQIVAIVVEVRAACGDSADLPAVQQDCQRRCHRDGASSGGVPPSKSDNVTVALTRCVLLLSVYLLVLSTPTRSAQVAPAPRRVRHEQFRITGP